MEINDNCVKRVNNSITRDSSSCDVEALSVN